MQKEQNYPMHNIRPYLNKIRNKWQNNAKPSYTWKLNNNFLNNQCVTDEIKGQTKQYLQNNENRDTTYCNLWNAMKAVLRGKYITINCHMKKMDWTQINNLILHPKCLEKEQVKRNIDRREEIVKVRAKINAIETKKCYKKLRNQLGFFERINKIDNPLPALSRKRNKKLKSTQ